MTRTDVVIVNYNAGPHLRDSAVSALEEGARAVIVVDNNSTDGSLAGLDDLLGSGRLQILRNVENFGFAHACNIGLTVGDAPFVMFLNPDARIRPGSLETLEQILSGDDGVGMVGPLLLNTDGTEQHGGRRTLPTLGSGVASGLGSILPGLRPPPDREATRPAPGVPSDVEAISGSAMMVKRAAAQTVGPWDEGYFLHVEDLDYCMRFRRAGWRIVFVPDAVVVHHKGVSSNERPVFIAWHKHRGMMRYYDKFLADGRNPLVGSAVKLGVLTRFAFIAATESVASLARRRERPLR